MSCTRKAGGAGFQAFFRRCEAAQTRRRRQVPRPDRTRSAHSRDGRCAIAALSGPGFGTPSGGMGFPVDIERRGFAPAERRRHRAMIAHEPGARLTHRDRKRKRFRIRESADSRRGRLGHARGLASGCARKAAVDHHKASVGKPRRREDEIARRLDVVAQGGTAGIDESRLCVVNELRAQLDAAEFVRRPASERSRPRAQADRSAALPRVASSSRSGLPSRPCAAIARRRARSASQMRRMRRSRARSGRAANARGRRRHLRSPSFSSLPSAAL